MKSKSKMPPQNVLLTPKQERFCQYYVECNNASEAYRMAYDCSKSKWQTICTSASQLLRNPKVALFIAQLKEAEKKQRVADRANVEQVLLDIVNNDPADMFYNDEATGKPKQRTPLQMSRRQRNAIKRIVNNRGSITIDFNDKTAAAALLAKMNAWLSPTEVNIDGGGDGKVIMLGFGKKKSDE